MHPPSKTVQLLTSAEKPIELLNLLKDMKNSVIGNPTRKVELAEEKGLIAYLITQLQLTTDLVQIGKDNGVRLEILNELFVILGTLANVGDLTLYALLSAKLPDTLLSSISQLHALSTREPIPPSLLTKLMPSSLRALRNISIAAADVVLGRMWGVGVEIKVVLSGSGNHMDVDDKGEGDNAGNEVAERWRQNDVKAMAKTAVVQMFHPNSLITLVPIMTSSIPSQSRLPLYQMFAHLTLLPSHRQALSSLNHPTYIARPVKHPRFQPAESPLATIPLETLADRISPKPGSLQRGPLVEHLCRQVVGLNDGHGNAKVTAACLDLLAAMCKDETTTALEAVAVFGALEDERHSGISSFQAPSPVACLKGLVTIFVELINSRTPGVPVAAANCLTNIAKALNIKGGTLTIATATDLLPTLIRMLGAPGEDSIHVCFIIAHLTSDEEDLQRVACDTELLDKVIALAKAVDKDDTARPIAENIKARQKEGCFLAMASLSFVHEVARATIVDKGMLPIIHASLSHPSYGVRAAACQATRALSRSIAVLRTSLVDSGLAAKVLEILKQEDERIGSGSLGRLSIAGRDEKDDTVLIAATATICNLITEFSPMQTMLIEEGGIDLLVRLCNSPSEGARTNAVWALKNMIYKNDMPVKRRVVDSLTWTGLKLQIQYPSPDIQEQGLALMRNYICDGHENEITHLLEGMGEEELFSSLLLPKLCPDAEIEPMEQALYVVSNIALGNDAHREAILSRRPVLQALKKALAHENAVIRIAALGCILNLVESNDRHRRPRQEVINKLKPLMLEPQIRQYTSDPLFDVRDQAQKVLNLMESTGGNGR